jgi:hypothetical protein
LKLLGLQRVVRTLTIDEILANNDGDKANGNGVNGIEGDGKGENSRESD